MMRRAKHTLLSKMFLFFFFATLTSVTSGARPDMELQLSGSRSSPVEDTLRSWMWTLKSVWEGQDM